jgi:hypothetical protein
VVGYSHEAEDVPRLATQNEVKTMIIYDKKTATYKAGDMETVKPHGGYFFHSDGFLIETDEYGTSRIVGTFATVEEAEAHMCLIEPNFSWKD